MKFQWKNAPVVVTVDAVRQLLQKQVAAVVVLETRQSRRKKTKIAFGWQGGEEGTVPLFSLFCAFLAVVKHIDSRERIYLSQEKRKYFQRKKWMCCHEDTIFSAEVQNETKFFAWRPHPDRWSFDCQANRRDVQSTPDLGNSGGGLGVF